MTKTHKVALSADGNPYVTHILQVPSTWEGSLEAALAFLTPQWELGMAIAAEMEKAKWRFSIGHTRGLASLASKFRTPHHEQWRSLRFGLPENLLADQTFMTMEPFWQYVLEAMFGQASGLGPMVERGLVSMRIINGLGGKYSDVFGEPSGNDYIPGIQFEWAHPTGPVSRHDFREVSLSQKPEILEGWRA